jgi:natural product biosynthesis luciferase-like monooxygenase protein
MIGLLRRRVFECPDNLAYTYIADEKELRITYRQLDERARGIALHLRRLVPAGERALLLYPSGVNFIEAFFGCVYADVVAVPLPPPSPNRPAPRLAAVLDNADAAVALTTTSLLGTVKNYCAARAARLQFIATDAIGEPALDKWRHGDVSADTIAMLQYTSGSTNTPKGVMLSHGNIMHNLSVITHGFTDQNTQAAVGMLWLPNYHDMGLIGGILAPLHIGCPAVLMSPSAFVARPYRWLQAITHYRGTISGAPNFAYEMCVNKITKEQRATLDLSSWDVAFCGAEPIRSETLKRFAAMFGPCGFRPEAFYPCYGLAEATLLVSGVERHAPPVYLTVDQAALERGVAEEAVHGDAAGKALVSCGRPLPGQHVVIVHPESHAQRAPGELGEVWVSGPSIAKGYWNRPADTEATFHAYINGAGQGPFLRTGDLGFIHKQELFITGRTKDMIIIRGRNFYPHDIEEQVERSSKLLAEGYTAAFSQVDESSGQENLVVVKEIVRQAARSADLQDIIVSIRSAIADAFDLQVFAVVLVREASLPKTSSGKIQRYVCRQQFLDGTLKVLATWQAAPSPVPLSSAQEGAGKSATANEQQDARAIEDWLISYIVAEFDVSPADIDIHQPFVRVGMDSIRAVRLAADLGNWLGRELPPTLAYDYPNIGALAGNLVRENGVSAPTCAEPILRTAPSGPIAIVGIGCRFPGASGPAAFWELLAQGVDAVTQAPAGRWQGNSSVSRGERDNGGFLQDIDQFDTDFFGISPREAMHMDPQQRLLMEVSWEALEDAGQTPEKLEGTSTGVFIGVSNNDYGRFQMDDSASTNHYETTGNAFSIAANRVSYALDLHGPSIAVDTACSSSLVAVHLACQSLLSNECESALVGGVNLILSPSITANFRVAGFMAADGRCKTFDDRADGYVRGEGVGVVLLKPLAKALDDGDSIYAVIRGSAVNHDGRTNRLTAPSVQAQKAVLLKAYRQAGISPAKVQYVEAHGTGTKLGDPIEAQALGDVLGADRENDDFCAVGSVKTNIGHLEAAAGIAGLIKTALALKHQIIPMNLHFQKPNSYIPFDSLHLRVQQTPGLWPTRPDRRRYAGVSSFGFGGTNAHVVLEEAPAPLPISASKPALTGLLPLSARSPDALAALVKCYADFFGSPATTDIPLEDVTYNAAVRRSHHRYRVALVAGDRLELTNRLREWEAQRNGSVTHGGSAQRNKIVFVFSGQGSQWLNMGQALQYEPVCRDQLQKCDDIFQRYADWSLLAELGNVQASQSRLAQTQIAQPAICAIQLALAALWRSWGIVPDAVVGHSMGEIAAAHLAGVLSLEDTMRVIYHRSRLMQELGGAGKMAVVDLSWQETQDAVAPWDGRLSVAANNGPRSTVLSGDGQALAEIIRQLERRGVCTRLLDSTLAFHSPQMEACSRELVEVLRDLQPRVAALPIISTVTGRAAVAQDFNAEYWGRNVREPVRFVQAITQYLNDGYRSFLEIGPHPDLRVAITQCLEERGHQGTVAASLRRNDDPHRTLPTALAALYEDGQQVKWEGVYSQSRPHVALPAYPWQRQRYWRDDFSADSAAKRVARADTAGHPLLGQPHDVADAPQGTRYWNKSIEIASMPYLSHHILRGVPVMPITVYLELALAAVKDAFGDGPHELSDVSFEKILFVPPAGSLTFQVALSPEGAYEYQFKVHSRSTDVNGLKTPWVVHAHGRILHVRRPQRVFRTAKPSTRKSMDFSPMFFAASQDSLQSDLYRLVIEVGKYADRNGFSGVWVPERHFTRFGAPYPNPAVLQAALARETQRIRLRAGSIVVPLHNPIRIAEEWAMVDNLSGGRVELSCASGWHPDDFALSPEKYRDRHAELFRGIEVIQRLWRGEPLEVISGSGERVAIRAYPTPVQNDIPLWITAAGNPDTFVRAGEIGANVLTHLLDQDIDTVGKKIVLYRESLARHGHDPDAGRVAIMLHTFIGEKIDVVREQVRKPYCDYLKTIAPLLQGLAASRGTDINFASLDESEQDEFANFLFERLFSTRSLLGTADSCAGLVEQLRSIGVDEIACLLDFGPDTGLILENLPHLRDLKETCNPPSVVGRTVAGGSERPEDIRLRCTREITGDDYYRQLGAQGIQDSAVFLAIEHLWCGEGEVLGRVRVFDAIEASSYEFHPAFLAACFQVLFGAASADMLHTADMLPVPVSLDNLKVYKHPPQSGWVWTHARLKTRSDRGTALEGDVSIFDQAGDLVMTATGLKLQLKTATTVAHAPKIDHLLYDLKWRKTVMAGAQDSRAEPGAWIIFSDATGVGQRLAALLEEKGHICFLVLPGRARRQARRYRVPLRSPEAMENVFADIAQRTSLPVRGVVHLWGCGTTATHEMSADLLDAAHEFGVGSALDVVKSMVATKKTGESPHLWLITRNAQIAGGRPAPLAVEQAPLWGFARVVSAEMRELWGGVIDLDPEDAPEISATRLFDVVTGAKNEDQIAFHEGNQYVARLVRRPLTPAAAPAMHLRDNGSYLITGGLGDLGLAVARWLAVKGARHLVLLGRTELPPRDQWRLLDQSNPLANKISAIQELERMGANVYTAAVDIASETQVSAVIEELHASGRPQICGVIHCAAVYDGAMLANLDQEALAAVLRPKARGAWVLHRLLEHIALDLFVVFSAIPSLIGWVGQGAANYAAANAFLDALAYHRRSKNLPAISISWGPWGNIGIAARTEDGLNKLAQWGVGSIQPALGLNLLEHLLAANPTHTAAVQMDWPKFFNTVPNSSTLPLFAELTGERAAIEPGEQSGGTWSLSRKKIVSEGPAERHRLLTDQFREKLAQILRIPVARLDVRQPLNEVGLDSLMAIEFRTAIQVNLGVAVPLVTFLQGPSLVELAHIVMELITGQENDVAVHAGMSSERGATTLEPVARRNGDDDAGEILSHLSEQDVDMLLQSMQDENLEEN